MSILSPKTSGGLMKSWTEISLSVTDCSALKLNRCTVNDPKVTRISLSGSYPRASNLRICAVGLEKWKNGGRRGGLVGCRVAFTTPAHYAPRLEELLRNEGAETLWCPTIITESTDRTREEVASSISEIHDARGVAFTSRAGIKAFAEGLDGRKLPEDPFIVAALGRDAEYLFELDIVHSKKGSILTPSVPAPRALVEALGQGKGRKILCPVPLVLGVEEPPVVPDFLQHLRRLEWDPVRVNSYVTRWLGGNCVSELLGRNIDALVFTSTAEIEGFIKSLIFLREDPEKWIRKKNRSFLIATHGPVTAHGANSLGVQVDVVGTNFHSFSGVVNELMAWIGTDRLKAC